MGTKNYANAADLVDFTRASTGTYLDKDGTLKTAAVDAPRIEYNADGTVKGLLIEESRTNFVIQSDDADTQVINVTSGEDYTISFTAGAPTVDLDETITKTAVDVFVYDTTKDSDGGAWTNGTLAQASSWYNETLNTATRGSRREFPAVAVIVAEADKVTIYDGDDPSLPMWMVFEVNNPCMVASSTAPTLTSVVGRNGEVIVGSGYIYGGVSRIQFPADTAYRHRSIPSTNKTQGKWILGGIAARHKDHGFNDDQNDAARIINEKINDVAMTVLPDAPIDPATGLPVPTIAVATAGGVSVITDSGAVYDSFSTAAKTNIEIVGDYIFFRTASAAEAIQTYRLSTIAADGFVYDRYYRREDGSAGQYPQVSGSSLNSLISGRDTTDVAVGYVGGGLWKLSQGATGSNGAYPDDAVAKVTSTYNTGWMNGDIKGAFLSSTDTASLVGGSISTDTYSLPTGWSFSAGTLSYDGSGSQYTEALNTLSQPVVVGRAYRAKFTVSGLGVGEHMNLKTPGFTTAQNTFVADGTYEVHLIAATTSGRIGFQNNFAAQTFTVTGVSLDTADADRSVNDNGLIVNGTITRDPVASGADLVAYSGFSASNYLEQPYNSALDFGTGDFCVMGWVSVPDAVSSFRSFERNNLASPDVTKRIVVNVTGGLVGAYAGSTAITSAVTAGVWNYVAAVRSGGVFYLYVNGVQKASQTNTLDLSLSSAITRLGSGVQYAGANHSLALWRISATAPTADQIAKIYEDEKLLFQTGAQATLYGSSDAVTALAHDQETDLLHVGTSAGRSVFKGLRRINNTTDAVTTAISAHDGLIAEQ